MLVLHKDSHLDHEVPREVIDALVEKYKDCEDGLCITLDLAGLGFPNLSLGCMLVGPVTGWTPVIEEEVEYRARGNRTYPSRMLKRKLGLGASTNQLTLIAGPHDGQPCVLYTVFPGPIAPRELGDPSLEGDEALEISRKFWAEHALAE